MDWAVPEQKGIPRLQLREEQGLHRGSLPEARDREVGKPPCRTWRRSENELVKREGGEGGRPEREGERL